MPAASDGLVCRAVQKGTQALQSPQEEPTSGFPCTMNVTAYSALSPGHCPPSLHRTPCGSPTGRLALLSCNLSTSLGCQDHTALPYALCCGRQSRRSRSLLRTSTASAPRSLHNVPATLRVHRDPACASDVGQRPSEWPERFGLYARRYIASSENCDKSNFLPGRGRSL